MRRLTPAVLGLLALTGSAGSTGASPTAEVASVGPVDVASVGPVDVAVGDPGAKVEVLQGTVTGVADAGERVEVLVRMAWAPVLRAENRTLEVHVGPVTRFVPSTARGGLRAGDEVQVRVPLPTAPEAGPTRPASEIALLDLG